MSTAAIELPLFPLNVVLFPGTIVPLYIFEPRYRQMIKDCQEEEKPFGIVLVKPESEFMNEEPYSIGTIAEIHNLQKLEDGGYNLMAVGVKRFRILSKHNEKAYISGLVEPFEDQLELESELTNLVQRAHQLFETYLNMLLDAADEQEIHTNLPEVPEDLSHFIAYFLEVEDDKKQQFLELTSTKLRLQEEVAILRREIPFMRQLLFKKMDDDQTRLN